MNKIEIEFKDDQVNVDASHLDVALAAEAYYRPLMDVLRGLSADGRNLEITVLPGDDFSKIRIVDLQSSPAPPSKPKPPTVIKYIRGRELPGDDAKTPFLNFWPFTM